MAEPAPKPLTILCLDLTESQVEAVTPLFGQKFATQRLAFGDTPTALDQAFERASLVLIRWDGTGKKASAVLTRIQPEARGTDKVFAVTGADPRIPHPQPRELRVLGLSGAIELPGKYFEVERLLHDLAPPPVSEEKAQGSEDMAEVRLLQLPPPRGGGVIAAAQLSTRAWSERVKGELPPPRLTITVAHPDEAFGGELARFVDESGAPGTRLAITLDDTMREVRRGTAAVVLWFDGEKPLAHQVLEHMAEARRCPWTPVLVMVPGKGAMQTLVEKEHHLFFDTLAVFERKKEAVKAALLKLKTTAADPMSMTRILMQLRTPFFPGAGRRQLPLEQARELAKTLGSKPGKRYWGHAELIPHLLAEKKLDEAKAEMEALAKLRPQDFGTQRLQMTVDVAFGDRGRSAAHFVKTLLASKDTSADRLYRVADALERWKLEEPLADLLDGWQLRPDGAFDHQLEFMAARYYRLMQKPARGGAHLAAAVAREPMRAEYLELLAVRLGEMRLHEREAEVLKTLIGVAGDQPQRRIRLVKALLAARRMGEAREIFAKIAALDHPDVKALRAQLGE